MHGGEKTCRKVPLQLFIERRGVPQPHAGKPIKESLHDLWGSTRNDGILPCQKTGRMKRVRAPLFRTTESRLGSRDDHCDG